MDEPTAEQREAWDLAQIRQRRSHLHAKPIGSVVRRLMASTGYGETQAVEQLRQQWNAAVGEQLAGMTRPGNVARGVLYVYVSNSAVMQELHFRRKQVLQSLQSSGLATKISDLRIRMEPVAP